VARQSNEVELLRQEAENISAIIGDEVRLVLELIELRARLAQLGR
jgi:hypothetical protein